ncbi:unnamed protein product [Phytophthora fragariaefolia]|uniref:Unnamed protein product n=1 Tax=Phytophthora fragariaefolia TaxID=1490495 RepID=A0A9W6YKU9_9STRA|nr:unnamed protein product [Phytophthora fragariaefolia]
MPPTMMPRSCGDSRRRPASAAAVSTKGLSEANRTVNMENMIQAAHEHLVGASPRSCSPRPRQKLRDNQKDGDQGITTSSSEVAKLEDHMDGFPLVPLPVIPQLGIADLGRLERGLNELLRSLMPHESDQQLGRYATRQLELVQRQLTQQRAQERVFRMLQGELPVTLAPIEAVTLKKSSSAAAAGKIGLTSRPEFVEPSHSSSIAASDKKSSFNSQDSRDSNEAANRHWKGKKAGIEIARAMIQANAGKKCVAVCPTAFVVSVGGNLSRKRRRQRIPKRSPEEEARYQSQQLERERENRRQAAYQRLLARRELQAKRKQEHKQTKKDAGKDQVDNPDAFRGEQDEKQQHCSNSECGSETSDVSNCSESDEANEKAILALEVHITPPAGGEDDCTKSERSESDEEGRDVDGDCEEYSELADSNSGANNEQLVVDEHQLNESVASGNEEPANANLIGGSKQSSSTPVDTTISIEQKETTNPSENEPTFKGKSNENGLEGDDSSNDQQKAIVLDLQRFMNARAATKLKQLQEEKDARQNEVRNDAGVPVISLLLYNPSPTRIIGIEENVSAAKPYADHTDDNSLLPKCRSRDLHDTCQNELIAEEMVEPTPDEKPPSWIDEVRQSAEEARAKSPENTHISWAPTLPRAPVAECKDYRFYFSNFHCILTSVFEQCRSNSSNSSSASSLYHRPVGTTGEHTMRLQQKLYESWQSIMQDYATVFGPKIEAPKGMVPLAAAKPWAPHYRINSTARKEVSEIVTQALQRLGGGWEEHPSGLGLKTTWNLLWTWSKPRVERQTLLAWQKVNHFQHAKALTRKDCLKKHIGKYLAAGGRLRQAFDIIPPTFLLPKEYVGFVHAFQERCERLRRSGLPESKNIWIMKPVALSRGRGISLVNDLSQVIYGEQVVIQEYIAAPRLLDGFKFDLRLYVLVTSFNPLEAFLYDEGFVRLCTRPYEDSDLSNIFVHLTNSSIQKDNEEAIAGSANPIASAMKEEGTSTQSIYNSDATQKDAGGTKTTLAYLWRRLEADGVDVEQVKRSIEEVVVKALLCGEDQIPFQVNSFDLLGYDILLDADLRPWLIEINSSPSMARDNDLDYQVKDAMMLDTLRVVDPLHFDRAKLAEVIARRQRDLEDEKRRPHAHTRHPREAEELAARQLNEDLTSILRGKVPRGYGELPENIGNYRRLCPQTTIYNQLVKLKRSCLRGGERKA